MIPNTPDFFYFKCEQDFLFSISTENNSFVHLYCKLFNEPCKFILIRDIHHKVLGFTEIWRIDYLMSDGLSGAMNEPKPSNFQV